MAARPIDAAEGYRVFTRFNGNIELDEINEYLRGVGLLPVSPRMLQHYHKLRRHGYESYVPINRLDVAVAGEYAWSDELRARYREISRPLNAEIIWQRTVSHGVVESLGTSTATVVVEKPPAAGSSVVLRLSTTGIERTGDVVRVDPMTGRFHIAFDPYTSLPLAARDSPYEARFVVPLEDSAQSVVVVADLLVKLDRLLLRAAGDENEIVRVREISLNSPLDIVTVGGVVLMTVALLLQRVTVIRKIWYEGTKLKYEGEGLHLDNDQKRRSAQLESDRKLLKALDSEVSEVEETPTLDGMTVLGLPKGGPDSPERRTLVEIARRAIDLPIELEAEIQGRHPDDDAGTS